VTGWLGSAKQPSQSSQNEQHHHPTADLLGEPPSVFKPLVKPDC
jgi:hypothetical protein